MKSPLKDEGQAAGSSGMCDGRDHNLNGPLSAQEEGDDGSTKQGPQYCQVVIIGAGVCGLQCAKRLFVDGPLQPEDVVLLEARNRIGGRVKTREYQLPKFGKDHPHQQQQQQGEEGITRTTKEQKQPAQQEEDNTLWIDDGAAWVHGVEPMPWQDVDDTFHAPDQFKIVKNPVLEYLNVKKDLHRVVRGNPWTRPYTVLHRTRNIALFLQQPSTLSSPNHNNNDNGERDGSAGPNQPLMFSRTPRKDRTGGSSATNNYNQIIHASIRRHFQILRHVDEQVHEMYSKGQGVEANTKVSLFSSLEYWNQSLEVVIHNAQHHHHENGTITNNMNNRRETHAVGETTAVAQTILSLTSFYQHLLTCWHGFSLDGIPIAQYGGVRLELGDDRKRGYASDEDDDNRSGNSDSDPLWDDEEFEQDGDFIGAHCTVRGGMHRVVQALCTPELVQQIRLGQEVVRIQRVAGDDDEAWMDKDGTKYNVRVETNSGLVVFAKACVVTIPVGCLKENHSQLFADTTPLSLEKKEAFDLLSMGRYKKVFLTFDSIFWPTKPAFLGMILHDNKNKEEEEEITNPLGTCLLLDNLWSKDGYPCLEAVLAGDQGIWATNKPDTVIRDTVLDFLQKAMNPVDKDLKSSCLDCHITRWEEGTNTKPRKL